MSVKTRIYKRCIVFLWIYHFLWLTNNFVLFSAVCNQTCLNGGLCTSPGICTCRKGYVGASCEQDLDECAAGLHTCKSYSYCVNMPGWYYCKCKPGYETNGYDCHDINECDHNTHSCHPSATCINSDGNFECLCPDDDTSTECRLSTYRNIIILCLRRFIRFK